MCRDIITSDRVLVYESKPCTEVIRKSGRDIHMVRQLIAKRAALERPHRLFKHFDQVRAFVSTQIILNLDK
jgi:precorrin-6B methylase 2